jgi:hypothetical protein
MRLKYQIIEQQRLKLSVLEGIPFIEKMNYRKDKLSKVGTVKRWQLIARKIKC